MRHRIENNLAREREHKLECEIEEKLNGTSRTLRGCLQDGTLNEAQLHLGSKYPELFSVYVP